MKIAITTEEKGLNSNVSPVFGRSPYITVVELENNEIIKETTIENPFRLEKGAGNMVALFLVNNGIDILISGEMGPVAFYILKNKEISVYKAASVNVNNNLRHLTENKLKEVTSLSSGYPK
jgi:predicted Fe-Mo cluster-binding NifX family protein